ncbi:MAG: DNA-binding protein [Planctomycetes bacterium]|nr:DNA-binding protein [Planctomycetota bacterium]MBI3847469.1 DNA-binding protein [Planctomycetota bacterium]
MKEADLGDGGVALRFERGEEVVETILAWAKPDRRNVVAASLSGIGALEAVELGFFDRDVKRYERVLLPEVHELLAINGTLARLGAEPILHAHVTLGARDFSVRGGHFFRGIVAVTVEIVVQRFPSALRRGPDAATGLNFIQA